MRSIRWVLVAAAVGAPESFAAWSAIAAEPASFEWNAPLSCPTRDAILERLGGGASGAARAMDTRVTVEQDAEDHYRARVDLVAGHRWSDRSLEASTCEAIADAVVVIVRVAAASVPAEAPPTEPLAVTPRPVAPSPLGAAPAATTPSANSASDAAEEDRGRGFSFRTAFALDAGSRYDATPGFAIGAAWRGAHVAFALDLRAFAPPPPETLVLTPTLPPDVAIAGTATGLDPVGTAIAFGLPAQASVWLLTASAEACASEPLRRGRVFADACLGLVLERPRFDSSAELGLVPIGELAAEWWLLRDIGVRASTRWLLDIPRRVPTTALVAFEPSLGIVMQLGK